MEWEGGMCGVGGRGECGMEGVCGVGGRGVWYGRSVWCRREGCVVWGAVCGVRGVWCGRSVRSVGGRGMWCEREE